MVKSMGYFKGKRIRHLEFFLTSNCLLSRRLLRERSYRVQSQPAIVEYGVFVDALVHRVTSSQRPPESFPYEKYVQQVSDAREGSWVPYELNPEKQRLGNKVLPEESVEMEDSQYDAVSTT